MPSLYHRIIPSPQDRHKCYPVQLPSASSLTLSFQLINDVLITFAHSFHLISSVCHAYWLSCDDFTSFPLCHTPFCASQLSISQIVHWSTLNLLKPPSTRTKNKLRMTFCFLVLLNSTVSYSLNGCTNVEDAFNQGQNVPHGLSKYVRICHCVIRFSPPLYSRPNIS